MENLQEFKKISVIGLGYIGLPTAAKVDKRTALLLELSSRQKAEDEIKRTLTSFERHYRSGNASSLVSLYSPAAKENQFSSRGQILKVYQDYFSALSSQHIDFSVNKIKKLADDRYFVSGNFVGATKKGLFKNKKFNSSFTIEFEYVNGKVKILEMNY